MSAVGALRMVLGDQLSPSLASLEALDARRDVVLIAEVLEEARHVPHHPLKLTFVFSAMRHFAETLRARGIRVRYVTLDDAANSGTLAGELQRAVAALQPAQIHLTEAGDWRVEQALRATGLPITWHADRRFLCSRSAFARWAQGRQGLRMEHFYRGMRKRTGLLMGGDGEPEGGAWNFDAENRQPPTAGLRGPRPLGFAPDGLTGEVQAMVRRRFADHYGAQEGFDYPVTREDARRLWAHFLERGLAGFGDHQDAMVSGEPFLFHARISAALNVGLLEVRELCDDVEQAWRRGEVPLNAAEGFIRQVIGWREYVRGIYWLQMPEYARRNAFGNTRALPAFYWTGETRMNCMRQVIGQTLTLAYAHHIQRLMVTGNFALLTGIEPGQICDWYLAVYMDAFDWVELPNTLGMVMHADGGYLGSKPYCASGQYIRRMSDYCAGCAYKVGKSDTEDACPFNALYWHFLIRHREALGGNHRLRMVYRNLDRQSAARVEGLWRRGEALLARLDAGEPL